MNHLSESIQQHIRANWPMLCYVKPHAPRVEFWFSNGRSLANFSQGIQFYIQGFDPKDPAYIWSGHSFDRIEVELSELNVDSAIANDQVLDLWQSEESEQARQAHDQLVTKAITAIERGLMSKVVLSYAQQFSAAKVDWLELLRRLIKVDRNAFRYLLLHPELGLWCGATPEVLVSVNENNFSTMALAGTRWQKQDQLPTWTQKEFDEHNWVVREIIEALGPLAQLHQSDPYSHHAGGLQHLRTDISGTLIEEHSALDVARSLHPTPAVCGYPKNAAFNFIQNNEGYNRMLYTGYIGLFNPDQSHADFYVNLRCLQYTKGQFHLYVGGGLTINSQVQKEWEETQRKMSTMGQVIAPFIEQR